MSSIDDLCNSLGGGILATDPALLSLLVHVAYSDGELGEAELAFLARVLPGRDSTELRAWVVAEGSTSLDINALAAALPTTDDRWRALRFAVRMAYKDGTVSDDERALLSRLVQALGLPASAVDDEMRATSGSGGGTVTMAQIEHAFSSFAWDTVERLPGPLQGDLGAVVPADASPVCRVLLDGVEFLGFFREGLAGRFQEGTHWVAWTELVTFTRVPTFASAVQLHAEDGRTFRLTDFRLSGLGTLLDRIFAGERRPESDRPKIELVRGRP